MPIERPSRRDRQAPSAQACFARESREGEGQREDQDAGLKERAKIHSKPHDHEEDRRQQPGDRPDQLGQGPLSPPGEPLVVRLFQDQSRRIRSDDRGEAHGRRAVSQAETQHDSRSEEDVPAAQPRGGPKQARHHHDAEAKRADQESGGLEEHETGAGEGHTFPGVGRGQHARDDPEHHESQDIVDHGRAENDSGFGGSGAPRSLSTRAVIPTLVAVSVAPMNACT